VLAVSRHQRNVIPSFANPDLKEKGEAVNLPGAKEASLPIVDVEVGLKVRLKRIRQLYRIRVRKKKRRARFSRGFVPTAPVGSRDMHLSQSTNR